MRKFLRHHRGWIFLFFAVLGLALPAFFLYGSEQSTVGTFWSLLPVGLTVLLLIFTREVYSSLFAGILSAVAIYACYSPREMLTAAFEALPKSVGTMSNLCILIFLVLFSALMSLVFRTRGAAAFAALIGRKSASGRRVLFSTALVSLLFFFDDYFCCLACGGIARPLAERHKIPNAKLAFVLDATAAPLCILVPITSWSLVITGAVGEELFFSSIPFNFYSIIIIAVMLLSILIRLDLGAMKRAKSSADAANTKYRDGTERSAEVDVLLSKRSGNAADFIAPMAAFLVFSVLAFLFTGYVAAPGGNFRDLLGNANASVSIVLGCAAALIFTVLFYAIRGVLRFKDSMETLPRALRQVGPILLMLVMAWTFSYMLGSEGLGLTAVLGDLLAKLPTATFLPLVAFCLSAVLALATGSSYATFAVMLPLVMGMSGTLPHQLLVLCVSAVLSGAVLGDHASPVSDTTLISSAAADCDMMEHVITQLPYVGIAAFCSAVGYLVAGLAGNGLLGLAAAVGALGLLLLILIPAYFARKKKLER